ncbi:hypothetical protein RA28_00860 [Ruegeria sp. ANG-S4]|uniref:hypothetical protein n=1 Tax=Ruegeria sp. ANG-S4 TaxID=1577904 RepID=UPI00057EBCA9|nr:hypothetical protein [Ruegeria sp. ANG-S4]KIC46389.1 hypothetical protein RA28_00860 [Ruegeria sp. ANG-S4]
MVYEISVDMALSAMKVSSAVQERDDQLYAMGVCETMGLTPCEAAVVIMAKDDEFAKPKETEVCIKKWACEGRLDPTKPAARDRVPADE